MKHLLITGISGFVGTNLVRYFQEIDGIVIHGYSRDARATASLLADYPVDIVEDLSTETLDNLQIDVIIHLAGIAHDLSGKYHERDYELANYELTRKLYDEFSQSKASTFVFASSIKAVVDHTDEVVTEDFDPRPASAYGISKRKAEEFILSQRTVGKQHFILRPCMTHGPGNKGNLNTLYEFIQAGIPYPLGSFINKRSFLSIDNFCFVIKAIVEDRLSAGEYLLCDDEAISTVDLVKLMGNALDKKVKIWKIPRPLIRALANLGSLVHAPFNNKTIAKLSENMVASNARLKASLKSPLPVSTTEGLAKTIKSFNE